MSAASPSWMNRAASAAQVASAPTGSPASTSASRSRSPPSSTATAASSTRPRSGKRQPRAGSSASRISSRTSSSQLASSGNRTRGGSAPAQPSILGAAASPASSSGAGSGSQPYTRGTSKRRRSWPPGAGTGVTGTVTSAVRPAISAWNASCSRGPTLWTSRPVMPYLATARSSRVSASRPGAITTSNSASCPRIRFSWRMRPPGRVGTEAASPPESRRGGSGTLPGSQVRSNG